MKYVNSANMRCGVKSIVYLNRASPVVQEAFVAAWDVLNSVAPRELWVSTVNFLCANDSPYTQVLSFATTIDVKSMLTLIIITINRLKSLIADPLIIFKADTRIFRSPMLFSVFLTVCSAYFLSFIQTCQILIAIYVTDAG